MHQQYHFRQVAGQVHIYNVNALLARAEALPVQTWLLTQIQEFDEAYWYDMGGQQPTCRHILGHMQQMQRADLSFPVLVCRQGRLIDGMHRVFKAHWLGHTEIKVQQLEFDLVPDFINVSAEDLPYD